MKKSICELRRAGFKVRVLHERLDCIYKKFIPIRWFRENHMQHCISPFSGRTTIEVTDKNGQDYKVTTVCSMKDQFNRKIALSICLGRLQKQMEV